jgi:hypothetical protein
MEMKSLLSRLFAFVAIFAIPLCALASDISCDSIPELRQDDMSQCECGKSLSKLPITSPKGMSLIAACGYKKEEFVGVVGEFYFKGKATVKGEVKRVNSPVSGSSVLFDAKASGQHSQFSSAILSMRFGDDSSAIQKFKLPSVSEQSPCLAADAVISVTLLHVKAGYESDEEGSYPKVFEVLKVGEYGPCQEQQEKED